GEIGLGVVAQDRRFGNRAGVVFGLVRDGLGDVRLVSGWHVVLVNGSLGCDRRGFGGRGNRILGWLVAGLDFGFGRCGFRGFGLITLGRFDSRFIHRRFGIGWGRWLFGWLGFSLSLQSFFGFAH